MTSRVQQWWLSVVGAGVLLACGASPYPHATAADVAIARKQRGDVTLQDLEQGRSHYLSHCGACHQLVDPKRVAPGEWPAEVEEMRERAKLTTQQVELIATYLVTISSRH